MWSRRQFIASVAALGTTSCGVRGFLRDRPDVLLITVDDLRPQLGCYGLAHVISPNIDALASEGVLFEQARAQLSLCTPSRNSMMSGLRPDTSGMYTLSDRLVDKVPELFSLPRHFRAAGYRTVSVGKVYHHGAGEDPEGWTESPWDPANDERDYLDPASIAAMQAESGRDGEGRLGPSGESPNVPDEAYVDGKILERALSELRRPRRQPLLLSVGFHRPHMPLNAPRRYWDLYSPEALPMPELRDPPRDCPSVAIPGHDTSVYTDLPRDGSRPDAVLRHLIHGYHACVSYVDALVGRLLEELDALKRDRDTVVLLVGDHGYHLGDHGLWGKHSNFDVAARAPLILRSPGHGLSGRRCTALVELVDVYPTLCEACELPIPEHVEGASLVPLTEDPDLPWKEAVFYQNLRRDVMGRSVRTARYRYTRYTNDQTGALLAEELYDHDKDPGESVNLAHRTGGRETTHALAAVLERGWRAALPTRGRA